MTDLAPCDRGESPDPCDPAPKFTDDRRHRLVAAQLGAHAQEFVTIRAGDVERALETLGENETLRDQLTSARAQAAVIPILHEKIAALQAEAALLRTRADHAARILQGRPAA